jgi:hypothetical protein|tara:strand:+ start:152 stop:427 length:276 start_codon:yes stop_codon:yes gene_type:complete
VQEVLVMMVGVRLILGQTGVILFSIQLLALLAVVVLDIPVTPALLVVQAAAQAEMVKALMVVLVQQDKVMMVAIMMLLHAELVVAVAVKDR